jgi:serine/threonine-protein kinase
MTGPPEEFLEKALSAAFALEFDESHVQAAPAGRQRPSGPAPLPERIGRYKVEALVGRGGIGLVLRAHDPELDRRVALKILHEHLASDAEMVRRFVDEAKIAGGLEHPGVVPVHEMGRSADGRPYFTMKLIEGETLASRLSARKTNAEDRLEFLSTFQTICQILGYAHSRGVAHLDVKPSNILVGGFGEVLVTDWGFSSSLAPRPDSKKPDDAAPKPRVVGTPAYMSPEQARGDLQRIGPRSDVFALGAMLCEILTGTPAYAGDSASEILLAASRAWLDDAWKRLDGCTADATLVALARRCLAPEPEARPGDAVEVAAEIGRYLRALEDRAQALAIEAAEARTKAAAERRQRRFVVALTALAIAAAAVVLGAWLWIERARTERLREDDRLAAGMAERVRILTERARNAPEPDPALWEEPSTIAHQAAELARARGLGADVRGPLEALAAMTDAGHADAVRDDRTLKTLQAIHERLGDARENTAKERDYKEAFKAAGIDLDTLGAEAAASRITASRLKTHLLAALDDAAHVRRLCGKGAEASVLVQAANRADPNSWRSRVRTAAAQGDAAALEALAASPDRASEPAESQLVLATGLRRLGKTEAALKVLEDAERAYPGDYDLHHELAMSKRDAAKPELDEAIRHFSMALALRPRSPHAIVDLGQVFLQAGNFAAAERLLDQARKIDASYAPAWHYLGALEFARKNLAKAETAARRSVELDPGFVPSRVVLAMILRARGDFEGAVASFRAALEREPNQAEVWCDLGQMLFRLGRFLEARECIEKCDRIGSKRGAAWTAPTAEFLERADELIAAEKELASIGSTLPEGDPAHLYSLAEPALFLGRPLTAAKIMYQALDGAPPEQVPLTVHLLAAKSAASAGTGGGKESIDPQDMGVWRERARTWLSAALDNHVADKGRSKDDELRRAELEFQLVDPAFAGVREPSRLAGLGGEERTSWNALWDRFRKVLGPKNAPESR